MLVCMLLCKEVNSEGDCYKGILINSYISPFSRYKCCLMNMVITALYIFITLNRHSSAFTDIISLELHNQWWDKPHYHLYHLLLFSLNNFSREKPVFLSGAGTYWDRHTSRYFSFSASYLPTFPDIPNWLCSVSILLKGPGILNIV